MKIEEYEKFSDEQLTMTRDTFLLVSAMLATCKGDVEKEVADFYRKYGKDGVITYQEARMWVSKADRRRRLFVYFLALNGVLEGLFKGLRGIYKGHMEEVVKSEYEFFETALEDEKLHTIVNRKWGEPEDNWKGRLSKYEPTWRIKLANDAKTVMLTGNDMHDLIDDYSIRFKSMEKVLWSLLISETTAVSSLARKEIFKDKGAKQYKLYSQEDERVCTVCGALHGKIFPMSAYEIGVTASPLHTRCRCFEIMVD